MIQKIGMNARQKELLEAAIGAVKQSREQQQLDALLLGISTGFEGKLLNADTVAMQFSVEVPDIKEEAA